MVRAGALAGTPGVALGVAPGGTPRLGLGPAGAVAAFVARQIEAHERGEPLTNLVDRRRGY